MGADLVVGKALAAQQGLDVLAVDVVREGRPGRGVGVAVRAVCPGCQGLHAVHWQGGWLAASRHLGRVGHRDGAAGGGGMRVCRTGGA